jgi:hypothetical protein
MTDMNSGYQPIGQQPQQPIRMVIVNALPDHESKTTWVTICELEATTAEIAITLLQRCDYLSKEYLANPILRRSHHRVGINPEYEDYVNQYSRYMSNLEGIIGPLRGTSQMVEMQLNGLGYAPGQIL